MSFTRKHLRGTSQGAFSDSTANRMPYSSCCFTPGSSAPSQSTLGCCGWAMVSRAPVRSPMANAWTSHERRWMATSGTHAGPPPDDPSRRASSKANRRHTILNGRADDQLGCLCNRTLSRFQNVESGLTAAGQQPTDVGMFCRLLQTSSAEIRRCQPGFKLRAWAIRVLPALRCAMP